MLWRRTERTESSASEHELLRLLRDGNEESMATIYRRHGDLVFRFSMRMVQDESIAEEITQEVFLTLLNEVQRFDETRSALSTWLCGIARRLVWKHLRARQRDRPMPPDDQLHNVEGVEEDPCELLTRKEALLALERGIEALPTEFSEVVILCELEEMKYEDAAVVLGVPIGTVRSRLHRAKRRLARLLVGETARTNEDGK